MIQEFEQLLAKINDIKQIYVQKNLLTKKLITPLLTKLQKTNDQAQKKQLGLLINSYKKQIDELVNSRIKILKANKTLQVGYDPTLPSDFFASGSFNPIDLIQQKVITFFQQMGFYITTASEVTSVSHNFDLLNISSDHPARSLSDTFYINKHQLLRVHNTANSFKMLQQWCNRDEIKVLSYGNVYRKDDDDATHSHQFNQIDMVWVKKAISVANLKWISTALLQFLFFSNVQIRYRLSYFPFTEPSFEIDIGCFFCQLQGCKVCKNSK